MGEAWRKGDRDEIGRLHCLGTTFPWVGPHLLGLWLQPQGGDALSLPSPTLCPGYTVYILFYSGYHLPSFQFPFSDPLEYSLLLTSWIVFQFVYANMRKLKCTFILFFWFYTKYTMLHILLCTFLFSFNNISWQAVYREVSHSLQSCILFDCMDGL